MNKFKKVLFTAFVLLLVYPFDFLHDVWRSYARSEKTSPSFFLIRQAYASILATAEEALQSFFPKAEFQETFHVLNPEQRTEMEEDARISFDETLDQSFKFFVSRREGKIAGYAAEDVVRGKWGAIHYMVAFDPKGKIQDVMVLDMQEKRGKPVAKRRFLKQFFGKKISDDIRLRKDIRGVTGATISSRGMTDGIRKMTHLLNFFYPEVKSK